ncbi:hypothetical protein M9978_21905 [Sphingomonas sp. MG17]|jgi:hypothetical protein|uniref:Uncharacterized protein n=1 Tax=Sphingomonas tagetis TaxID=2949092 RepID=A0A9X2HW29_9SPHN|nr:hypothetical protein [Sphingomonas tagetis]MCP3733065.1 hypothetical protein [Sphingomonas tagetis]
MKPAIWKKAVATAVLIGAAGLAAPAYAGTGCNGVVNIFVWGCAPWDNNNGAQYPYFKKRDVAMRVPAGSKITIKDGHAFVTIDGRNYPVIGGASGVVAAGGGNVVAAGGGNVVASGGLNLRVWEAN